MKRYLLRSPTMNNRSLGFLTAVRTWTLQTSRDCLSASGNAFRTESVEELCIRDFAILASVNMEDSRRERIFTSSLLQPPASIGLIRTISGALSGHLRLTPEDSRRYPRRIYIACAIVWVIPPRSSRIRTMTAWTVVTRSSVDSPGSRLSVLKVSRKFWTQCVRSLDHIRLPLSVMSRRCTGSAVQSIPLVDTGVIG